MIVRIGIATLLALILSVANGGSIFAQAYTVTVLPIPQSQSSSVLGINNSGQVVGGQNGSNNLAFIATASAITYIPAPSGSSLGSFLSINDSGQVAGGIWDTVNTVPFIWDAGGITRIPIPPWTYDGGPGCCTYYSGMATSINNSGQVAGSVYVNYPNSSNFHHVPFIGTASGVKIVPVLSQSFSDVWLTDINDFGQVVGKGSAPNGSTSIFIGDVTGVAPVQLPVATATSSDSSGPGPFINDSGLVAANGGSYLNHSVKSFVGNANGFKPIPLPSGFVNSEVDGINDSGQVVGVAITFSQNGFSPVPFVGTANGTSNLLNLEIPPGPIGVFWPSGINNKGQILALGYSNYELLLTPATTINQVAMFDSHTLQVDVTTQFSQNAATSKSISVRTTINGVPLQSIFPLTSATGTQSKSLFIDLSANNVPRFTDNQIFDVTATATENGAVVGTATKTGAEIPLPVVHVHGILADCLGDRIEAIAPLFNYLQSAHPSYTEDPGVWDGTANNRLDPIAHPYPTLVSFDYQSMKQSVNLTASSLATFIQSQVLANTWAAKVNVVAHSMGGIIARSAIVSGGQGGYINRLILVGSPSEGSTLAPIALSFWGPSAKLVGLVLQQYVPGLDFVSSLNCVENGNQTTTQELLPTYPWYASSQTAIQQAQFPQPQPNPNPTLPAINQAGLDPRVAYYAIVASGEPTPTYLWGRSPLWPTDVASDSDIADRVNAWGPGDGIVPIRSQLATDLPWPKGNLRGQLKIYDDVGFVWHTGYFDQVRVQGDVNTILWP